MLLYAFVALAIVITYLNLVGKFDPVTSIGISLLLVGVSLTIGVVSAYILVDKLVGVSNPKFWGVMKQIASVVGLDNIITAVILVVMYFAYDILTSPIRNVFVVPQQVTPYGTYTPSGGLTFGQNTVVNDVILLNNIGKMTISSLKMKRVSRKKESGKIIGKKNPISSLKDDFKGTISGVGLENYEKPVNVVEERKESEDIEKYAVRKYSPKVNPETLEEMKKKQILENLSKRDENLDRAFSTETNYATRNVENVYDAVRVAFMFLANYVAEKYGFSPEIAMDDSRYRLVKSSVVGKGVWEFIVDFNISTFSYYRFAVYVSRDGRVSVNLLEAV